jgi:hypothetical protein
MTRIFVLALLLAGGCYAEATYPDYYGYDVTWGGGAPVYYETAPRVWYHGGWAYWYGDRWYWNHSGHWGVFNREPHPLYQYRVYSAPPAFHTYRPPMSRPPVYSAPPAYRSPVYRAPPHR